MGTSIGKVIDTLVDRFRNGTATVPALTTINPLVEVVDNLFQTTSGVWVVIGRTDEGQGTAGTGRMEYLELGARRISEQYTLPGFVMVMQDGTLQKPVRDAAIALFDGVVKHVHDNPTLGGVLQQGRISLVSQLALTQAIDSQDVSAGQVVAAIHFEFEILNTYIP